MRKSGSGRPLAISKSTTLRVVRFYALLGSAWIVITDGMVFLHGGEGKLPFLLGLGKGLLFVLATSIALYLYMTRRVRESRRQSEILTQRLTQLSKYANDIVLLFDEDGRIIEANDRAADAYGYPLGTLLRMTVRQLREPAEGWRGQWDAVVSEGEIRFEAHHRRADGSLFPVEVSSRRIDTGDRHLVQSIVRDITERKETERQIVRLKDVYAALSQTNQCIVRTPDREELFRSVCDIAIQFGHFQLAWVGLIDESTGTIVPVAKAGRDVTYLEGVLVSSDPASRYSSGPTGQAVLTERHLIANDFRESLRGKPWQERVAEFNLKASAAFPLYLKGKTIGALTLYSGDAGYFTPDLIDLLDEMALDISYALQRMEEEKERRLLEQELVTSNARIQGIVEGSLDVIAAIDTDFRFTLCNRQHSELFSKAFTIECRPDMNVGEWRRHPSDKVRILATNWTRALDGEKFVHKWSCVQDGEELFYESYFAPLLDKKNNPIGAFHVGRNVTNDRKMEFELRKLTTAVEQSPITVLITDLNGSIEYVNPAFTMTSGYAVEEVLGKDAETLLGGDIKGEERGAIRECLSAGDPWFGLLQSKRKDGTRFWEEAVIAPIRDATGAIIQCLAIKQDITMRLEAEERATFLTFHDPLTKLPNRILGKTHMDRAMVNAEQLERKLALLFIDVDHFKRINDSLGYRIGDRILQALVERMQKCLRETDTMSRLGGDEFLIVLSAVEDEEAIDRIATTILEQAAVPFSIEGFELSITLSIGVAIYPDDGRDFDLLHKQADMAMSVAKKSGRNTYRFYSPRMETDANEYLLILNGLRKAVEHNEFVLHYQPQICLDTGQVIGAEALIRWNHPELGFIPPGRFISVAEDSGLIVEMGEWVLREACRQAVRWQRLGLSRLVVSVNLSAVQFKRGGLPQIVRQALDEANLEPACLCLELTESILLEDNANVLAVVKQLKSLGVSLSLDDFGTGYASFAYLRSFDLDELKIDQSFIREITRNPGDERIVKSIVELAKGFGLRTIAEGVEDAASLDIVRRAGCDRVQGYYFARPMPEDDFAAFMASDAPLPE
jgi:diguanylate cyclase (GGDEF)-like protein/PAS domain S-box-containing protein